MGASPTAPGFASEDFEGEGRVNECWEKSEQELWGVGVTVVPQISEKCLEVKFWVRKQA